MSDGEREKFIRQAIAPMAANAELELLARARLVERMEGNPEPAEYPELRGKRGWKWLLWLLALGAFVAALWRPVEEVMFLRSARESFWLGDGRDLERKLAKSLDEGDRIFVFGDLDQEREDLRWLPLRKMEPDDPAVLARYASAMTSEDREFSNEIWADVERIDPRNGWYDLIAGGRFANDAVEADFPTDRERAAGKKTEWRMLDSEAFSEALRFARNASQADFISSRSLELLRRQMELLSPVHDHRSSIEKAIIGAQLPISGVIAARKLGDCLSVEAWRLAEAGDHDGIRELAKIQTRLSRMLVEEDGSLVNLLVARVFYRSTLDELVGAAGHAGLSSEHLRELVRLRDELKTYQDIASTRDTADSAFENRLVERGPILASMTAPLLSRQVAAPPAIPNEDLLPGRRADHAIWTRVLFIALAALLGLVAGAVALVAKMTNRLDRSLASSVGRGWTAADHAWIVAAVCVPLAWFALVRYGTPWGGLDWSVRVSWLEVGGSQIACLVVMLLAAVLAVARWRMTKRFGFLGSGRARCRIPLLAAISAGAALPWIGSWTPDDQGWATWHHFGWLLGGLGLVALVATTARTLMRGSGAALDRLMIARLYLAGLAGGVLAVSLLTWALYQEERHWVRLDPFSGGAEGGLGFLAYEEKVVAQGRKELLELLNEDAGIGP